MKTVIALFVLLGVASSMVNNPSFRLSVPVPKDDPLVEGFRPPAVPLVVMDPFMSIWSFGDNLYDTWPTLWCGVIKALAGAIRIDGKPYRFMGPSGGGVPIDDVITQTSVRVQPTQTIYTFETSEISLEVRFTTTTIPTDLDLLSQPVTYISFNVTSLDGQDHQIEIYYDQTAEITVSDPSEQVTWNRVTSSLGGPTYIMQMGTTAQNILGKSGDCDGINWGYAYLGVSPVDANDNVSTVFYGSAEVRASFAANGTIPTQDDTRKPRAANDDWPVMAVTWSFQVTASQSQSRYLIWAYDDIFSIDYFGYQLPPYWRRNNQTAESMLYNATRDYSSRIALCNQFDSELLDKVLAVSNQNFTTIASLSYRQAFGGCKLVWNAQRNTPWYFMKEISSDGDLQTVDVIFPASPVFFYTNPLLVEFMMLPLLAYANNETNIPYNLSWAPHHLGTYPIGNLNPNQQEQMPVEETGNLLMMIAALNSYGKKQGKDYQSLIFPKYQDLTDSWANYLLSGNGVLPDPGDQLCTDDFLGPSPHNVNLALKGIVGLANYAHLCTLMGRLIPAYKYSSNAKQFSQYWLSNANDTDHYRLQYNLPNSSSLKYNMLYQYIVGTSTFPDSVMQTEVAYYLSKALNQYGVPLNSEVTFTKLDWLSWIAAMAPNKADGLNLLNRIYDFANTTPNRVPLTDWYDTIKGTQNGFQARTVVGGVYAWMLLNDPNDIIE